MIGFLVAGGLTQIFSLIVHRLKDCRSHTLGSRNAATRRHVTYRIAKVLAPSAVDEPLQFWINIISALLIGLSDQQLVMGLLVLALIAATKGMSFSMYMTSYISYFTLITHAATMVTLRPYFRKYRWMTVIRILIMLAAFSLWVIISISCIGAFDILSQSTLPEVLESGWDFSTIGRNFVVIFCVELGVMSWIYLSMVPSLFISDRLIQVRKAVGRWPMRKEKLDDSAIRDWILEWSLPGDIILWPYKLFCRLFLHTKSKIGRAVLWVIAEIFFPWSIIPATLLLLFIGLLFLLIGVEGQYSSSTEWNFGQLLPVAMVALPFWALVQGYAGKYTGSFNSFLVHLTHWYIEDKEAAIEEKKGLQEKEEYANSDRERSLNKPHAFSNELSVDSEDGDVGEPVYRPRSPYFAHT